MKIGWIRPLGGAGASIVALTLVLQCAACSGGGGGTPSTAGGTGGVTRVAVSAGDRKQAEHIFEKRCTTCHGPQGRGDGPGSAGLNPKPRNYHDKVWQAATSDDEIEKAIVYGGAAVGKSPAMAANPDLSSKPGVVTALREHIRDLGKQD